MRIPYRRGAPSEQVQINTWESSQNLSQSQSSLTTRELFRGADLTRVDLTGADLRGADLTGADLRGADLSRRRI